MARPYTGVAENVDRRVRTPLHFHVAQVGPGDFDQQTRMVGPHKAMSVLAQLLVTRHITDCKIYPFCSIDDMQYYARGPKEVAIFTEFPGRKTPVASEGAEWRLARKAML